ncbi:MAG: hypothetical protein ACRD1T_09850, partial [Acidimicrobiia bacterium]
LQSVVGLGGLSLAVVGFWLTSFVLLLVSYSLFYLFNVLALLTGLVAIGVWMLLLVKAFQGRQWKLPFAGDIAERYS